MRDDQQGAGQVEGYETAARLESHARNIGVADADLVPGVQQYLARNAAFLAEHIAAALPSNAPNRTYWWHVHVLLEQQRGLFDGYQQARHGCNACMMRQ